MGKLFEATEIRGIKLRNRFIRSATWEGLATEKGECTQRLTDTMAALARGGVGLIVTGHAYVIPEGKAGKWQLGVYEDSLVDGLRKMANAVHEQGGSIVMQIAHAGFSANTRIIGKTPIAPSDIEGFAKTPRRVFTKQGITELVNEFGDAAARAKDAGFDGVQLHVAHGYLLSQFISPAFNIRDDEYGGSVENRARVLVEAVQQIRSEAGDGYPVLVKLNNQDYLKGGLSLKDSVKTGLILQDAGVAAIELSGGTFASGNLGPVRGPINKEEKEVYFKEAGKAFKSALDIPISLVGGIRTFQVAEKLVEEGHTDYISMSRPFIREPGIVNRWQSGDLSKSGCISDSKCFEPGQKGEGIYCVIEKREKEKAEG